MRLSPDNEQRRLQALEQYDLLNSFPDFAFDSLIQIAAEICATPFAAITFIGEKQQWFQAKAGLRLSEMPREISFCAHTILTSEPLIVPDATQDPRFAQNPLVSGEPQIRFYAGVPLINADGHALGTICVMDKVTRQLSESQLRSLKLLGRQAMTLLELQRRAMVKAPLQMEEQYHLLFENNPQPMWVFDQETLRFLEVNEAAIAHYGYSREEFLARRLSDIRPEEDIRRHAEYHQKVMDGEITSGLNPPSSWRHQKRDGTIIDVEITWTAIEFRGVKAQLVLVNDITERRKGELQNAVFARLAQSLSGASSAVESAEIIADAADALLGWDACSFELYLPETNQVENVLSVDSIGGVKVKVSPAYERSTPSPRIAQAILEGGALILRKPEEIVAKGGFRPFGNMLPSASIILVPIRSREKTMGVLSVQSYRFNAYGEKSLELMNAVADQCGGALERINAVEKLAKERNLLRTLLDHLPDHVFVKDLESRHLLINKALLTLRGFTEQTEIIGRTLREYSPREISDQYVRDDQEVFRAGKPLLDHEEKVIDAAGRVHWMLTTKVPLRDADGKITGLVGISRDITESKRIKNALQETEELFRLIAENVTDMISVVDVRGRRLFSSPSCQQIHGEIPEKGSDSFELIHPEDAAHVSAVFENTVRTGIGQRIEFRLRLPDGKIRHIESQGNYIRGNSRESGKVVIISRDISARKQIERRDAALSQLGQKLSSAVSPKEAAHVIGNITRELFSWDAFTLNLYSPAEDVIRPVLNIDTEEGELTEFHPGSGAPNPRDREIIQSGKQLILKAPPLTMLPGFKPAGDKSRPSASLMLAPIRNGTKVIGILSIQSYDLNAYNEHELNAFQTIADHCGGALERISVEEALRSFEIRFHSVWENSVDGMRLTDENGIIVAVNKSFCNLVEMERDELIGKPFTVTYGASADQAELLQKYWRRFKDRSVARYVERKMVLRSGKTAELEGANSFVDLDAQRPLLLGLFRDVTEQKRLENQLRQSQKMESVGQLAGGIAHDFNNLLTVIQGHAALLQTIASTEEAADSLQQISIAAERSANLTRQLLTFSRRQVMQRRSLDFKEVVDEMSKMLRRILGEDIALRVANSAELPRIDADRGMIEQVILNLAINSRDAMPRGGELLISTKTLRIDEADAGKNPEARSGEFICLEISDTGGGISAQNLPHIFEPFFTTKEFGKGTGLGLATVYGIVKQHDGWIEVASEINKGSVFKIFFPRSNEDAERVGKLEKEKPSRGVETILLVEDEGPLRQLVQFLLERLGYRVFEAESGVAALKIWEKEKQKIDLLFTDLVMPEGMTGRDLSVRLCADNPGLKVIFTSGYSADILGKDFLLRDGINFLQKPYHPDKLAQTVRDVLDGK